MWAIEEVCDAGRRQVKNAAQWKIPIWREGGRLKGRLCAVGRMRYALRAAMRRSLQPPIAPGKALGAWVCLVAALLLWSPMWAAAWQANRMECCDTKQCPVHAHHSGTSQKATPADNPQNEPSMDCHRSGSGQLMQCSMSCCHDQQRDFAAAVVFVLPAPVNIPFPMRLAPGPQGIQLAADFSSFAPLSPPPRASVVTL
jgi:hypothetical protein